MQLMKPITVLLLHIRVFPTFLPPRHLFDPPSFILTFSPWELKHVDISREGMVIYLKTVLHVSLCLFFL